MMSLLLREFDFNIKLGMAIEDTEKFDEKLLLISQKLFWTICAGSYILFSWLIQLKSVQSSDLF